MLRKKCLDSLFLDEMAVDVKKSMVRSVYIRKVSIIQDQFVKALQIHLSQHENGARLTDILTWSVFIDLIIRVSNDHSIR